jgi:Tol biopolymer transport system component
MVSKYIPFLALVWFTNTAIGQIIYPDKSTPSDIPKLFGKGVLSDGLSNRDFTISPDGGEIFFTLQQPRFLSSTILRMKKSNGKWGKPEVAPFSGKYRDLEASFSPDGNRIFFSSDRPVTGTTAKQDFDIWEIIRLPKGGWGTPVHLDTMVNSDKDEYCPSVAKNGDLYFTVAAAYGKGKEDIVMCTPVRDVYSKPVSLPEAINSPNYEFNPFIDPDEQFIIFSSQGRKDDLGGGDLYISRKDKEGSWLPAKHLPAPINSAGLDYCPYVTRDKKYFIFTSNRANSQFSDLKTKTYQQLKDLMTKPGNGFDDIYWVKFDNNW